MKTYKEIRKAVYDACERAGITPVENKYGIGVLVGGIFYNFNKKAEPWLYWKPAGIAYRENELLCSYDTAFDTMLHHIAGIFTEDFVKKTCFGVE